MDADEAVDASVPRRFGDWRREARAFLELFALTGVAVVQPTFDTLRRNANDVFIPSGATRFQILALVAIFLLVPPTLLWVVEVVVGLALPKVRRYAHVVLASAVFGLIVFEIGTRQTDLGNPAKIATAVVAGCAGALLLLRFDAAGMFLRYLSVAPVIFTVLFLLSQQISPLVLSSGVSAKAGVKVSRPDRVVMIVLDELPLQSLLDGDGQVDAGLYPNLAQLQNDSTWYRNTTSVAPYTAVAVPALLTGNYPTSPKAVSAAAVYPDNLFTLLGDTYSINSHENLEALNPAGDAEGSESLRSLLRDSFDLWKTFVTDEAPSPKISQKAKDHETGAFRRFTASLGDATERQLDYLHVLLPHYPWHLLPDGTSYTETSAVPGLVGTWGGGPELAAVGRQRHILQLQVADQQIGKAVAKLKRLGVYDKTLIVVTADHGEGFTAYNPIRKATPDNFSEVMWVPLFIKAPGQTAGAIDDRMAQSIDVLPTIADTLGIEMPWKTDGRSLLGPARPNGPRRFLEIDVADASTAPSEAKYRKWSGKQGFERVLESRAAAAGGDESLRVYKGLSKFGDLVGQAAAPLVTQPTTPLEGYLGEPGLFAAVDPTAKFVPWTLLQGRVNSTGGRRLAITVNGTVASLTETFDDDIFGGSAYAAVLPPGLFRPGANDVQMYVVTGTTDAPHLELVKRLN